MSLPGSPVNYQEPGSLHPGCVPVQIPKSIIFLQASPSLPEIPDGGLLAGGGTTVLFWVTEFMVASVILMGLGLDPYVVLSFFFQILIAIIMMIPTTPGSSGITELSTSSLYALIVPAGMLGIFVLLWRFVTFYLNIILGTIAGMLIVHREIKTRTGSDETEREDTKEGILVEKEVDEET